MRVYRFEGQITAWVIYGQIMVHGLAAGFYKVVSARTMPICLCIRGGGFCTKTTEVSSDSRDHMACKPKIFTV